MIRAEVIKSGTKWTDRFNQRTIKRATVDALRGTLPSIVEEARRNVPVSPFSKEHLKDTIGYGIDREKGYGYVKAGGTPVVWYAHLIELGFHGYTGKRKKAGKRIRGNYRTHMKQSGFHKGSRFMGNAVQAHSEELLKKLRSSLRRRLSSG